MTAVDDHKKSKRERQKETRRQEILEAGFQVFTAQGFTAARLEDVAAEAGVGKGTIYLYFENKESLFEEVVRQKLFPAVEELQSMVRNFEGSAEDLLFTYLRQFYAKTHESQIPPLIAMVIGEGSRFPQLSEFFFRELISKSQDIIRAIIERGVASGEFRDTGLAQFPQILAAPVLISGIWKLQYEKVSHLDLNAFIRTHLDLILNGLKTGDSP